jgi:hypothetical protein
MLEKYLQVQGIMLQPACTAVAVCLLNILLNHLLIPRLGFTVCPSRLINSHASVPHKCNPLRFVLLLAVWERQYRWTLTDSAHAHPLAQRTLNVKVAVSALSLGV